MAVKACGPVTLAGGGRGGSCRDGGLLLYRRWFPSPVVVSFHSGTETMGYGWCVGRREQTDDRTATVFPPAQAAGCRQPPG